MLNISTRLDKDSLKKKIVPILIIIVMFLLAAIPYFTKKSKGTVPTVEKVPPINIPKTSKQKPAYELLVKQSDFKFPSKLPLIKTNKSKPYSENEVIDVAKKLGFGETPKMSNDISNGKMYIFIGKENSLTIYSDIKEIHLGGNGRSTDKGHTLDENSLANAAKKVLTDKGLYKDDELDFSFIKYLNVDGGVGENIKYVGKNEANTAVVNFIPLKSEYKIMGLDQKSSPISIWMSVVGNFIKLDATLSNDYSFTPDQYQLLNYDELSSSLDKATFVDLDDNGRNIADLTPGSIKDVKINKVEIAYFLSSYNTDTYQPIYVLYGKTKLIGENREVNAILYLPALRYEK